LGQGRRSRIGLKFAERSAILTVVAALLGLTGCGGAGTSGTAQGGAPWDITFISATTGNYAGFGFDEQAGMSIAADDINGAGGIEGRKVNLHFADTQSDIAQAVSIARQQCTSGTVAILGPITSAEDKAVAPVVNSAGCPILFPSAAASGLASNFRPWTFQLSMTAEKQTPDGVGKFYDAVHPTSAQVIVASDDPSALDQGTRATDALTAKGVKVSKVTVTAALVDIAPVVTRVAAARPDSIVISTGEPMAISLFREIAKQNITNIPLLLTPAGYSSNVIKLEPSVTNGHYIYTQFWSGNPDPKVKAFVDKYHRARQGADPTQLATQGYDTLSLVKYAYEKCKVTGQSSKLTSERKCFRDAIQGLKDYKGLTGTYTMGSDGVATVGMYLLQFKNGTLTKVAG
jgi:branched-chain amino acid transport system substrate-binding protein